MSASLFFYGWWNPIYVPLLLASLTFNYFLREFIMAAVEAGLERRANILMATGVAVNVSVLGYFKYANFFIDTANALLDTTVHFGKIMLPLGISFITFQKIAYLVDARRGLAPPTNFLKFSVFVTFFPQLIAGPIVHPREVLPQLDRPQTYRFRHLNLILGLTIFAIGLFKKVAIADTFAIIASPAFAAADAGGVLNFFQAWGGVFAYTFQLYFDFSGYSDMAIGLGRMFGIKLPLNFNAPYRATCIIDFWRRWHMTLTRFLRDYLYIPLGGNRKGHVRGFINLILTTLLGGLWHGASWTFVFWGGLHGLYLCINHAWRWLVPIHIGRWWSRLAARLVTLLAVMFGWIFFRATTFDGALGILRGMINLPYSIESRLGPFAAVLRTLGVKFNGPYVTANDKTSLLWITFWIAFVWLMPTTQQLTARMRPAYDFGADAEDRRVDLPVLQRWFPGLIWRPTAIWAVFCGLLCACAILSMSRVSEFIYFQF